MGYRYFDGRPPSLAPILERKDSYRCELWREADLSKVFDAPAQLSMTERMTLFSLVLGHRPARALEIGSFRGGSAQIIVHAMDLNDFGDLVMVDPNPQFAPGLWDDISHRSTLLRESSPGALSSVEGGFDFVFIDGDHTRTGVVADLEVVTPRMTPDGVIILHDVLYLEIQRGIADALQTTGLIDCGCLCNNASFDDAGIGWAGLGMLRKPRT
jgi:predicted O-methyltransferase YrrM